MGMSTHAIGFKPADEKWNKMKASWEACEAAGVEIPQEVLDYFCDEPPGDKPGMEMELGDSCKKWGDEYRSGFEIDINKLPLDVQFIRIYNAY